MARASVYPTFGDTLRRVAFMTISMATTTGFVTADYSQWPIFAPMWMLFLTCVIPCTGSTGGGIKMFRALILIKQFFREMFVLVHPQAVAPLKIAGHVVANRVVYSVLAFIFVYFMSVVVLTFALLISGLDFTSAVTAIIASMNNAGPGLNVVGPGDHLRHAQRLPALDVHGGHVPGTRGNLHGADPVYADVLAQMISPQGARCETGARIAPAGAVDHLRLHVRVRLRSVPEAHQLQRDRGADDAGAGHHAGRTGLAVHRVPDRLTLVFQLPGRHIREWLGPRSAGRHRTRRVCAAMATPLVPLWLTGSAMLITLLVSRYMLGLAHAPAVSDLDRCVSAWFRGPLNSDGLRRQAGIRSRQRHRYRGADPIVG